MKKIILMTSAAVIAPMSAIAQTPTCTATPDCASLGYTESSCANGGVKCPWGNTWFCVTRETEFCSKYGFKYTCTGTGYSGGAGEACEGKYTSCTCASGYKWENGSCIEHKAEWGQCSGYAAQCSLGNILFSDGTCSANTISGKTPIAVVVYKSSDGNCGQAMALKSLGSYQWLPDYVDIPTLTNFSNAQDASSDLNSCLNTEKIIAAGNKSTYPAGWAAYEYKTEGTSAGDWCLPAAGIFTSYYNNQDAINSGFTKAGGTQLTSGTLTWSSSEYRYDRAWRSSFNNSYGLDWDYKYYDYIGVRPVLEF